MRRLLLLLTVLLVLTALLVPAAPAAAAWAWPVKGEVITPYRNGSDPYAQGQHRGIDIAASVGTPVVAAAGGEVRFAGTAGSSGLTVSVRTSDGYDTSYLHLSSVAVRAGARVPAGERLGAVGTSGIRSAAAPHLHFGVRDEGTRHAYHDPLAFLPASPAGPAPEPPAPTPVPAAEPARPLPVPLGRAPATAPRSLAPVPAPRALAPVTSPLARARAPRLVTAPFLRREGSSARPAPAGPVSRRAPAPAPDSRSARTPAPGLLQRAAAQVLGGHQAGFGGHRAALVSHPAALGRHEATAARSASAAPAGDSGPRHGARLRSPGAAAASATRLVLPPPRAAGAAATNAASRHHRGPGIGWALACGGLLIAAAILGLQSANARPRPRARGRLDRALRPVTGGRDC